MNPSLLNSRLIMTLIVKLRQNAFVGELIQDYPPYPRKTHPIPTIEFILKNGIVGE